MQNREHGAAHINIYYFLVLMIMFLGALWFGYVQLTHNNDLAKAAAKAQASEQESCPTTSEKVCGRYFLARTR